MEQKPKKPTQQSNMAEKLAMHRKNNSKGLDNSQSVLHHASIQSIDEIVYRSVQNE